MTERAQLRDFHVTVLRQLGLDDKWLTFHYGRPFKALTPLMGGMACLN